MGDRLYEHSAIPKHSNDDYNEEEEGTGWEYMEKEVNDIGNEEKSEELACPFCPEDFDVLELCCHIDADHRMEVKAGICPLCGMKVGIDMASHVIVQHQNILIALCKKSHSSPRSRSIIVVFRKELQEKHLQCIKGSSDAAADSTFLSFFNNPHFACRPQTIESASSTEASLSGKSSNDNSLERIQPSLSTTDGKNERARCEFLQELVLSTIFNDL